MAAATEREALEQKLAELVKRKKTLERHFRLAVKYPDFYAYERGVPLVTWKDWYDTGHDIDEYKNITDELNKTEKKLAELNKKRGKYERL